jgi:hypothetical protein
MQQLTAAAEAAATAAGPADSVRPKASKLPTRHIQSIISTNARGKFNCTSPACLHWAVQVETTAWGAGKSA